MPKLCANLSMLFNEGVAGTVFELSREEITRADDYEVDDYQRVRAVLKSGRNCWIYAASD
jgi:hypothetical protein